MIPVEVERIVPVVEYTTVDNNVPKDIKLYGDKSKKRPGIRPQT